MRTHAGDDSDRFCSLSQCCWHPWAAIATGCRSCSSASALRRTRPGRPTCSPRSRTCSEAIRGFGHGHWRNVGGLGGILVSKSAGWLFDAYRQAGIAKDLGGGEDRYAGRVPRSDPLLHLLNKHGSVIDLNKVELGSLPRRSSLNYRPSTPMRSPSSSSCRRRWCCPSEISYAIMFGICALAYIFAWSVMKLLVPRFKKIENL